MTVSIFRVQQILTGDYRLSMPLLIYRQAGEKR